MPGAFQTSAWATGSGRAYLLALAAAAAALIHLQIARDPLHDLALDSVQHLSVARSLLAGDGLATSVLYYEMHYRFGTIPAPQTVWPPGHAAAAAAVTLLGADVARAFTAISVAAVVLSSAVLFASLAALRVPAAIGAPLALLWLVSPPNWQFGLRGSSEAPFILFTCLIVLLLAGSASGRRADAFRWAGIGCCVALALCWRYQGVYLIPALLLAVLVWTRGQALPQRLGLAACALLPPAIAAILLFGRNLLLTGAVTGGHAAVVDPFTPVEALRQFDWSLQKAFARAVGLDPALPARALSVLAAVVAFIGCTWALGRHSPRDPPQTAIPSALDANARAAVIAFCCAYPLAAVAHMLLSAMTVASWYVKAPRYLLPLLPMLLVLVGLGLDRLRVLLRGIAGGRLGMRVASALAVPAWVFAAFVAVSTHQESRRFPPTTLPALEVLRSADGSGRTLQAAIGEQGSTLWPMLASFPHELHLLTQAPLVGLLPRYLTKKVWDQSSVMSLCDDLGVRSILVARSDLAPERESETGNAVFFRELLAGASHPRLVPLFVNDRVRLYRVGHAGAAASGQPGGPERTADSSARPSP